MIKRGHTHSHTQTHMYSNVDETFRILDLNGHEAWSRAMEEHGEGSFFAETYITSFPIFSWRDVHEVKLNRWMHNLNVLVDPVSELEYRRYGLHVYELRMMMISRVRGRDMEIIARREGDKGLWDERWEKEKLKQVMKEYRAARRLYIPLSAGVHMNRYV